MASNPSSSTPSSPSSFFNLSTDFTDRMILSVDHLGRCSNALNFFRRKLKNSEVIRKEFDFLQNVRNREHGTRLLYSAALSSDNFEKNRYSDVLPFDINRVILDEQIHDRQSVHGYINASLISFIATQGPLPDTIEDFWKMIFQYRCPVIVMLTRLVDLYEACLCGIYGGFERP